MSKYKSRPQPQSKLRYQQKLASVCSRPVCRRRDTRLVASYLACYLPLAARWEQAACRQERYSLLMVLEQISDTIAAVPQAELRQVLELRYLLGLSYEEISDELCYTERQVFRLLQKALKSMEQL